MGLPFNRQRRTKLRALIGLVLCILHARMILNACHTAQLHLFLLAIHQFLVCYQMVVPASHHRLVPALQVLPQAQRHQHLLHLALAAHQHRQALLEFLVMDLKLKLKLEDLISPDMSLQASGIPLTIKHIFLGACQLLTEPFQIKY